MKKLLTLMMLAYLLCAGCFAGTASADSVEDNDIQLLTDLGIIGEEVKAELNKPMQRIDFVGMFSSMENLQNASKGVQSSFKDVDFSEDYGDALAWLCMSGAISDAEYFNPEENISLEQAVKIMVTALGYINEANVEGGYPSGYMNVGSRLDLLEGIKGGEFTVLDACKLFRNALDAEAAAIRNEPYEESGAEKSMLERYYNVCYKKGRMTKNTLTKLNRGLSDSPITVAVENNEYLSSSKYDDLIGQSVTAYYRTDIKRENEVVGIYPTAKNKIVKFGSDDDTSFSDFIYVTYEGNKRKSYKIERSADVIYNGRIYTQYTKEELLPTNGDITLIDSEGDGEYETVIINSYDIYFAGNGTGDGVIYDKLGKPFIDLNEKCDYIIKENEKEADISEIKADDLLEVRISKGDEYRLIQIEIYRNAVSGVLEAISDSNRYFTIDAVEYEVSETIKELIETKSKYLDNIKIGMEICIYLDRSGRVGYFTTEDSENIFYTYLRKVVVDTTYGDETVFFRLMLPDGTWTTAEAADRITIDDVKKKQAEFVKYVAEGNIKAPIPAKCKMNSEGKISMVETLEKYDAGYEKLTYKRASRCFDGLLSISNDCAVFVIPGEGFEEDETMYEIRNAGYLNDGNNYTFEAYEVNDALVAQVILLKGNGKNTDIPNTESFMIVDDIYETVLDEEICIGVKAVSARGEYNGTTRDSEIEFVDRITGKYLFFSQLNKGDLIRVLCDNAGRIINGERLVDINKFKEDKSKGAYTMSGGYRDGLLLRGGFVYAMYQDIIAITNSAGILPDSPEAKDNLVVYSAQSPATIVYDIEEETVREGNLNDIISYKDFEDKELTSFVYIQSTLGDPKFMVIYK